MTGRAIILTGCAVAIAAGAGIWLWGIDQPETKPDAITAVSVDEGGEQRAQPRETAVETLSEPSAPEPVPTEDLALATRPMILCRCPRKCRRTEVRPMPP